MPEYAFDNRAPEADAQLRTLEALLDPLTAARLTPVLAPGATCWEVGAGGGSVARLMARAVGPAGRVVATDIEPARTEPAQDGPGATGPAQNLSVLRHDVRGEPAPGGPFDVIHARLVLLHLPERRRVLRQLGQALAPGGWLVVEEWDCATAQRVLAAPSDDAAKLFQQVVEALLGCLQERGADLGWAQNVHTEMIHIGLTEVDTMARSESWTGGSAGMALHRTNSRQLEPKLRAMGVSAEQLHAFRQLTGCSDFAAMSYQFVSTRGRRPV
jgi:ubiquinone/menaquinone biosynthesis C-methylase UbiE